MKKPGRIMLPRKRIQGKTVSLPELSANDIYYSPITLRQFEEDGIDTTGFQRAADHIDNPDLGRGISAIFGQWDNIDKNGQNIIPFGFSNSWSESEKEKIADGALKMNPDLGCLGEG